MKTKNSFLELINDTKDRTFPLNYKFVQITEMPEEYKNRKYISVDLYHTNKYRTTSYCKPISKII